MLYEYSLVIGMGGHNIHPPPPHDTIAVITRLLKKLFARMLALVCRWVSHDGVENTAAVDQFDSPALGHMEAAVTVSNRCVLSLKSCSKVFHSGLYLGQ